MTGYYLPGCAAPPSFRLGKTLARLRQDLPAVTSVAAWAAYFVDASSPLHEEELALLSRLLGASAPTRASDRASGADASLRAKTIGEPSGSIPSRPGRTWPRDRPGRVRALVIPRAGTMSPWSSKATDIARNCGLERVRRVERGTVWVVSGSDGIAAPALGALYDRMTERLSVLPAPGEPGAAPPAPAPGSRGSHGPLPRCTGRNPRAGPPGARAGTRPPRCGSAARPRAQRGGSPLAVRTVPGPRPRPDRRRAHDVRPGELRALPAQDLQRVLDGGRPADRAVPLRHDPAHPCSEPRPGALRLP